MNAAYSESMKVPASTDTKKCNAEDGSVLIQNNMCRVSLGDSNPFIRINSWVDTVTGIQYAVYLDFGSTGSASVASNRAGEIIRGLFPEYSTSD